MSSEHYKSNKVLRMITANIMIRRFMALELVNNLQCNTKGDFSEVLLQQSDFEANAKPQPVVAASKPQCTHFTK